MSVKVSAWVWSIEQDNPVDRLVLLAIADCAADDGGNAWPSMTTLAKKACVTKRGAQIAVRRLVAAGLVKVGEGLGRGRCNQYTVLINSEQRSSLPTKKSEPASPIDPVKGEPHSANVVHGELETANDVPERVNVVQGGDERAFAQNVLEPSLTQTNARRRGWADQLQIELERFYRKPYPMPQVLETKRLVTLGIDTSKITSPVKYVMAAVKKDPDRYKLTDLPPLLVGRAL